MLLRLRVSTNHIYIPVFRFVETRTGALEFIFAPETKMYSDGIADALAMQNEEIMVGYITGGINSSAKWEADKSVY